MQEYETFCGRVSNGDFIGIGTSSAVDGSRLFSLLIHVAEALVVLWTKIDAKWIKNEPKINQKLTKNR